MPVFDCPICRRVLTVAKPDDAPFRPFCSQRCKLVDLGRWFDGTYSLSEPLNDSAGGGPAHTADETAEPPDEDMAP